MTGHVKSDNVSLEYVKKVCNYLTRSATLGVNQNSSDLAAIALWSLLQVHAGALKVGRETSAQKEAATGFG